MEGFIFETIMMNIMATHDCRKGSFLLDACAVLERALGCRYRVRGCEPVDAVSSCDPFRICGLKFYRCFDRDSARCARNCGDEFVLCGMVKFENIGLSSTQLLLCTLDPGFCFDALWGFSMAL